MFVKIYHIVLESIKHNHISCIDRYIIKYIIIYINYYQTTDVIKYEYKAEIKIYAVRSE